MRTFNDVINDVQLGKEFEDAVIEQFLIVKLRSVSCTRATPEQDKYEGTDLIMNRVRVDITYNFKNKDNLTMVSEYGKYWMMGIRTGNRHNGGTVFAEPVVVLGLNPNCTDDIRKDIIPNIKKYIGTVGAMAEAIVDKYIDYDIMVNGD